MHLIDRRTGARTVMIEGIEAVSSFEVVGDEVIGITTLDADRGRVVSAPLVGRPGTTTGARSSPRPTR